MNEADSRHLASLLEARGLEPESRSELADVIILNTCVVRQQAENKIYGRLGSVQALKKERPELIVAVMGCLVGKRQEGELRHRFPYVDIFMPPSDIQPLLDYVDHQLNARAEDMARVHHVALENAALKERYTLPSYEQGVAVTAFVPAVLGCSHACTYCVIPYRRGAERSRPAVEIVNEVTQLAQQGIKEVMLLGQIIDRYGLDCPEEGDLADLLTRVSDIDGIKRVRFLTSHPKWMTDRLIDTVAQNPILCPHFEVPFQAGNDVVLERMKRGYTVEEYRQLIQRIRSKVPNAAIHTDIIVGFPGETREQFMDTYRLLEELQLDMARIAKYSPRPQTLAMRTMEDDVPLDEKKSVE